MAKSAKSELVTWSSTFSVGIKIIDDQHKGLLDLTNDLFNHCIGDEEAEREYFKKVVKQLVDYVKLHFSTEEVIMREMKFAGLPDHKREHDAFVLKVVQQVKDFNEGKKFALPAFTKFLKNWVLTHIAISDKQYFEHLKTIAARNSDGSLSIPGTGQGKTAAD
ncbi:bacteriohemerythrin [Breznakiella homolactica]|uniref:Hemerythrin family protein n=1 Tax=Breznakiella homolactica TaxID=2798577 RepID=A0A7T7XLG3_9SPIR|nr:bacteriohemerythrin [Breznakiella homolactica]QQO08565.1 bacteriohemerythrin [Breznakiella homolactica]